MTGNYFRRWKRSPWGSFALPKKPVETVSKAFQVLFSLWFNVLLELQSLRIAVICCPLSTPSFSVALLCPETIFFRYQDPGLSSFMAFIKFFAKPNLICSGGKMNFPVSTIGFWITFFCHMKKHRGQASLSSHNEDFLHGCPIRIRNNYVS